MSSEEHVENKTWKFLVPCLRGHGEVFVKNFNPILKETRIYDYSLETPIKGRNLYILCDDSYNKESVDNFLQFVKNTSFFKTSYPYGKTKSKTMVVIELPERFFNAYDKFLEGKYSEMYSKEDIDLLFNLKGKHNEYKILTKDCSLRNDFIDSINKEFGTTLEDKDFEDFNELEFPLRIAEETFNYSEKEKTFFKKEKDMVWNY